jgi:hypothetical protein
VAESYDLAAVSQNFNQDSIIIPKFIYVKELVLTLISEISLLIITKFSSGKGDSTINFVLNNLETMLNEEPEN